MLPPLVIDSRRQLKAEFGVIYGALESKQRAGKRSSIKRCGKYALVLKKYWPAGSVMSLECAYNRTTELNGTELKQGLHVAGL